MKTTKQIAAISVFIALTAVVTILVAIPTPGAGYLNVGDAIVYIAAACLGPVGGMLSGGIGSAIADLALGYTIWAPFTLVVKGLEGLICGLLIKLFTKLLGQKTHNYIAHAGVGLAAMFISALEMITLYFFSGWIIGGYGMAIADFTRNLIQASLSLAIGFVLVYAINLPKYARRFGFEVNVGSWFRKNKPNNDGHVGR